MTRMQARSYEEMERYANRVQGRVLTCVFVYVSGSPKTYWYSSCILVSRSYEVNLQVKIILDV